MVEFGKTLIAAREARGIDIRQLAEMTRMAPTTIQELETENFTRIAAPIYGRGFVKLYCEAVGLDPKPLVEEFMELYSGNRDAAIRERPIQVPCAAEPVPADDVGVEPPLPERIEKAPAPAPAADFFQQDAVRQDAAARSPDLLATQKPMSFDVGPSDDSKSSEPSISRYAAPVRHTRTLLDTGTCLRLGLLAVGAIALLVLLLFGFRAVYRATTRPAGTETETAEETPAAAMTAAPVAAAPTAGPDRPKTVRTPQKIPSLYID